MIKDPFKFIRCSLKISVIYRVPFFFFFLLVRPTVILPSRKMSLKPGAVYQMMTNTKATFFIVLLHFDGVCVCVWSRVRAPVRFTCHRPRPEPPSRSGCGAGGPRGPPEPSGTSGCCCSCQGSPERRCGRRWRSLSCRRRMLRLWGRQERESNRRVWECREGFL